MMRFTENLVIGGGLAGAMAAMRLAAAGQDAVLLEKEAAAHHKVCGEFLSPEAVQYLCQAKVDPVSLGAASIRSLSFSAGNRVVGSALPFTALSLSRHVLDAALLARAAEEGCTVHRGAFVEKLIQDDETWIAELANGNALRARTVFLATGKLDLRGWSRAPGVQNDLVGFKMHFRLTPAKTAELRHFMELFLFSGGYGGLSLVERDAANLCLVVRRSTLRKLGEWRGVLASLLNENRRVRKLLEGGHPQWGRPLAISSIPYGYLSGRANGLWCLGDQAAVIPSFTGDGMSIALHSGALAAKMHLEGATADEYHRALSAQLKSGMKLATLLSRAMVIPLARKLAPISLSLVPGLIERIATSTRIPGHELLPAPPPQADPDQAHNVTMLRRR